MANLSPACGSYSVCENGEERVQLFDIQWVTGRLHQDFVDAHIELLMTYPFFSDIIWTCGDLEHKTATDGKLGKHHLNFSFRKPAVPVQRELLAGSLQDGAMCDVGISSVSTSASLVQSVYASALSASTDRFDLKVDVPGVIEEPIYVTFVCSGTNLTAVAPSPALAWVTRVRNPGGAPLLTSDYKSVVLDPSTCFVDCSAYMADMLQPHRVVTLGAKNRTGKTFGLSMLHSFLSPGSPSRVLGSFNHLEISKWARYRDYLGNYPVLNLDFSVFSVTSTDAFYSSMAHYIREVYRTWYDTCSIALEEKDNRRVFTEIMGSTSAESCQDFKTGLFGSFAQLCRFIFKATSKHPVVLVDGYDTLTRKLWYTPQDALPSILPMISLVLTATITENMCKHCAVVAGGPEPPVYGGFGNLFTILGATSVNAAQSPLTKGRVGVRAGIKAGANLGLSLNLSTGSSLSPSVLITRGEEEEEEKGEVQQQRPQNQIVADLVADVKEEVRNYEQTPNVGTY